MNVELLQKVKEKILAEPTAVNMDDWCFSSNKTPCGTVACIAGWACVLSEVKDHFRDEAPIFLKLNRINSGNLFYISQWPEELYEKLIKQVPGTPEYAAIVAARIDRFIETDGAE